MIVHLGQETTVRRDDIVGIFDLDATTVSRHTREYLRRAERTGDVVAVMEELPKSFIVCTNFPRGRVKTRASFVRRVYISPISSLTLKKRAETPSGDE